MSKLSLTLGLVAVAAIGLCGCQRQKRADVVVGGHRLVVSDRLVCPDHEGDLTRVSQSPDGQGCAYTDRDGGEIALSRASLEGRPSAEVLKALQQELSGLVPAPANLGRAAPPEDAPPRPPEPPHPEAAETHDGTDHAQIDLPGLHIHTDGEHASVRLPGVSINAQGDNAHITTGLGEFKHATIDAVDGAVRITSDMTDAGNVDDTWLISTDAAGAAGWRTVGYVARGPISGPLVIARLRSRAEHHHEHGGSFGTDDVRRLVSLSLK